MLRGYVGALLAAELEAQLKRGSPPLVTYSPEACEFGAIIDATPSRLKELGLYCRPAIEWRSGAMRVVSEQMIARALGGVPDDGGGIMFLWRAVRDMSRAVSGRPSLLPTQGRGGAKARRNAARARVTDQGVLTLSGGIQLREMD